MIQLNDKAIEELADMLAVKCSSFNEDKEHNKKVHNEMCELIANFALDTLRKAILDQNITVLLVNRKRLDK